MKASPKPSKTHDLTFVFIIHLSTGWFCDDSVFKSNIFKYFYDFVVARICICWVLQSRRQCYQWPKSCRAQDSCRRWPSGKGITWSSTIPPGHAWPCKFSQKARNRQIFEHMHVTLQTHIHGLAGFGGNGSWQTGNLQHSQPGHAKKTAPCSLSKSQHTLVTFCTEKFV